MGKKRSQTVWDSLESFLLHCSLDNILFPPGGGQAAEAVAHASLLITGHEAVPAPTPVCGSETGRAPGKQACRWLSGRSGRHTPRTRAAGAVTYPAREESIFGHGSLVRILFLEKDNVCSPKTGGFFFQGEQGSSQPHFRTKKGKTVESTDFFFPRIHVDVSERLAKTQTSLNVGGKRVWRALWLKFLFP